MSSWVQKSWGRTKRLHRDERTGTHIIEIDKNGYCSQHKHENLSNTFYVVEGKLEILTWEGSGYIQTILEKDEEMTVPAGQWHRFINRAEKTVCLELYSTPEHNVDDIVRLDEGGANFDEVGLAKLYETPTKE